MQKYKILLVDDNKMYRQAFKRNLQLLGFNVTEAENKDEAVEIITSAPIEGVITDLDMRYRTEGLELIQQIQQINPFLPVILISAVGTFEDGASAQELGALKVISKSSLDQELESLYSLLKENIIKKKKFEMLAGKLEELTEIQMDANQIEFVRNLIKKDDTPTSIKKSAFDLMDSIESYEDRGLSKSYNTVMTKLSNDAIQLIEKEISKKIPNWNKLHSQTMEAFRTAEFLWQNQETLGEGIDFSRTIGFAYTFAVENECKQRFKKNIHSFLKNRNTYKTLDLIYDRSLNSISLWYQRYMMFLQKEYHFQISFDNISLVIRKIKQLTNRFKPDGLKALGICLICFGRDYYFQGQKGRINIERKLNIGFNCNLDDHFIMKLGIDLISLQHYRNPFIHPEISGEKKISTIRNKSIDCLKKLIQI